MGTKNWNFGFYGQIMGGGGALGEKKSMIKTVPRPTPPPPPPWDRIFGIRGPYPKFMDPPLQCSLRSNSWA